MAGRDSQRNDAPHLVPSRALKSWIGIAASFT